MKRRGESLVGILVVGAIIVLLGLAFMFGTGLFGGKGGSTRADGKGETIVGKSLYAAKDDVCRSNLAQVRMSIKVQTDAVDDTPPQSIEETRLGPDFYKCKVGGEPYEYDPQTGEVKCVHPGHEKY